MMGKIVGWAGAMVLATAMPAMAQSACREPIVPPAIDGSTATEPQMKAQQLDVKTFLKDSDDYQECLIRSLEAAIAAAKKNQTEVDERFETAVQVKIQSNQLLKERVGALFNAAVRVFSAKHPG